MTLDWSDASIDAAVKGHFFFALLSHRTKSLPLREKDMAGYKNPPYMLRRTSSPTPIYNL